MQPQIVLMCVGLFFLFPHFMDFQLTRLELAAAVYRCFNVETKEEETLIAVKREKRRKVNEIQNSATK